MIKIQIVSYDEGKTYAAGINFHGHRSVVTACGFDEMLGVVAAAMLRPNNIPYTRAPHPWDDSHPPLGVTREQYEELLRI